MFVQTNSIQAIKGYFKDRLKDLFSESEIKFMFRDAAMQRLNLTSAEYLLSDDLRLSESDLLYFRSIVKRLMANEPYQYIQGKTEFFGLDLKIDARALIPRPEREEMVDWIISEYDHQGEFNILDLCAGSGCIPLALKSVLKTAKISAIDVSNEALQLAKENALLTGLAVEFFHGDLLQDSGYTHFAPNTYDIWVSNPPYIPIKDKAQMSANVLDFEPEIALFVEDTNPFIFYKEIGSKGLIFLKHGGKIFFEIHEDFGKEVIELLQALGFVNIELRKDLQGRDRMVKAQKP